MEVVEEETSFIAPAIRVECREHWPREWAVGGAGGGGVKEGSPLVGLLYAVVPALVRVVLLAELRGGFFLG